MGRCSEDAMTQHHVYINSNVAICTLMQLCHGTALHITTTVVKFNSTVSSALSLNLVYPTEKENLHL